MCLPLVNQFINPYLIWNSRIATQDDIKTRQTNGCHPSTWNAPVQLTINDTINTPDKAVNYILNGQHSNGIENFITKSLNNEKSNFFDCRQNMPSQTPLILSKYQRHYNQETNKPDISKVDDAILANGGLLSDNQFLFHGGGILNNTQVGSSFTTDRPLSTSFCPVKAFLNGMHFGKYYNENEVNIIVFTVNKICQPAFIFRINGTDKGHEKEVLIASGATLNVVSKRSIRDKFKVFCSSGSSKRVPAYLVEATIS